jgi:hypothetical protein
LSSFLTAQGVITKWKHHTVWKLLKNLLLIRRLCLYIKLTSLKQKEKSNLINKWSTDLNKYFTKEHIYVCKPLMKNTQILWPSWKLKSQWDFEIYFICDNKGIMKSTETW